MVVLPLIVDGGDGAGAGATALWIVVVEGHTVLSRLVRVPVHVVVGVLGRSAHVGAVMEEHRLMGHSSAAILDMEDHC